MFDNVKDLWNILIGKKSKETYAAAISSLNKIEDVINISTTVLNLSSNDFKVKKNEWTDLPSDISNGVSVMGLHIGDDYTSLMGYYTPYAYVTPHQHQNEWEIVKVLEGEAYDKTNNIKLTKGDVYIIPRNKVHNIVTYNNECYIYALFTNDKKFLKIPHNESDAAAKKIIDSVDNIDLSEANILYIDDERPNLTSFASNFRRDEMTVYTANNYDEALNILKSVDIHVLICDYMMPGLNGVETIMKINREYPDIVPIALTAYYNTEILEDFTNMARVNTCLHKPYYKEEIVGAIKYSYSLYKKYHE